MLFKFINDDDNEYIKFNRERKKKRQSSFTSWKSMLNPRKRVYIFKKYQQIKKII